MKAAALIALLLSAPLAAAAAGPRALGGLSSTTKRKEKVVVAGKVTAARTLDLFVLSDGSGEILLDASNVRHRLKIGDEIVVRGRFWGKSERDPSYSQIEALEIAGRGTPEESALLARAGGDEPSPAPAPVAPGAAPATSPTDGGSIEARLRTLDDLKAKKLVTDEEYRQTRRRILDGL